MTIVLRKPGKANYTVLNAHQPVTLLNTMANVLSACVAENITHTAEMHGILSNNYFGSRPGHTTMDTLHYVVKFVKDAWRRKEVVSALFPNIKSTFPSIVWTRWCTI